MKNLLVIFTFCLLCMSCSEDVDEVIIEEIEEETIVELPLTYAIIASDTFYLTNTSLLTDVNAYRVQLNFSNKEDLLKTNNDGNIPSIFAITISTLEKLTTSGSLDFSDQRSLFGTTNKVNFYQSYFLNTGVANEGKNYLSPSTGALTYQLSDDKLEADLQTIIMSNEVDETDTFEIKGHFDFAY